MKFTVDRERWYRGQSSGARLLRPDDGKMCCLGFFLEACGVPRNELQSVAEPNEVASNRYVGGRARLPLSASFLVSFHREGDDSYWVGTKHEMRIIDVNDHGAITDAEREHTLKRLFAEHGVDVTFVDSTPLARTSQEEGNG